MKFIFIVQGEGRGHLTQALTLERYLTDQGHQVLEVLVGKSRNRSLPDFFMRKLKASCLRFESPNFLPTPANQKNNITTSVLYNIRRLPAFAHSIWFIRKRINATGADVVVNFYELLTGLTYLFCPPRVRHICIGHQYLFLHPDFVFPKVSFIQLRLLKIFTCATAIGADKLLALSFRYMPDALNGKLCVVPPLLREEVLNTRACQGNYILGYMVNAGFSTQIHSWHKEHPSVPLRFFWDKKGETAIRYIDETLSFHPLDDKTFLQQMSSCRAYATTAGFESVCEAMYMAKPIMMVPAHIEQQCNAYDAMRSGAGIIAEEFTLDRLCQFIDTFKPDNKFVFWANNVSLLIDKLTSSVDNVEASVETVPALRSIKRHLYKLYKIVDQRI